jgi:uncharacterized membrane protein
MRGALAALLVVVVTAVTHVAHYLPRLPERVATHFNGAGAANGWMTRQGFAQFDAAMGGFVLLVIVGVAFLIRVLPASLINIPHRDHWLAPERRRQTADKIFAHMLWLACIVVAFLMGINHLTFLANMSRGGPVHLPGAAFVGLLVAFLAAMGGWVAALYFMFPRPAAER